MHIRQKFAHAHVSKDLKKKLGLKREERAGKEGRHSQDNERQGRGKSGKVSSVDLKDSTVYIDGHYKKEREGKGDAIPVRISKVYITELDLSDKLRKAKLGVSG